jgi:hypothetical protein
MSFKGDMPADSNPVRKLPDPAICRALPFAKQVLFACLVPKPIECKYAGFINDDPFCLHPDRAEIAARTKAEI